MASAVRDLIVPRFATIVPPMSDNQYIRKLQRARNRPIFTGRNIFMLMILSVVIAGGFYMEYGGRDDGTCDGPCESLYSLETWGLAIALIFGAVITFGAAVGVLVALIRRSRNSGSTLDSLTNMDSEQKN